MVDDVVRRRFNRCFVGAFLVFSSCCFVSFLVGFFHLDRVDIRVASTWCDADAAVPSWCTNRRRRREKQDASHHLGQAIGRLLLLLLLLTQTCIHPRASVPPSLVPCIASPPTSAACPCPSPPRPCVPPPSSSHDRTVERVPPVPHPPGGAGHPEGVVTLGCEGYEGWVVNEDGW